MSENNTNGNSSDGEIAGDGMKIEDFDQNNFNLAVQHDLKMLRDRTRLLGSWCFVMATSIIVLAIILGRLIHPS